MSIGLDFDDMFADSSKEEKASTKKEENVKIESEVAKSKPKKVKLSAGLANNIDLINKKKRNRKIFNGENTLSIKLDTNNVEFIATIKEELIALGLDEESYNRSTLGRAFLNLIETSMSEKKIKMEDIVTAYIK
jgi:hypothetical protein